MKKAYIVIFLLCIAICFASCGLISGDNSDDIQSNISDFLSENEISSDVSSSQDKDYEISSEVSASDESKVQPVIGKVDCDYTFETDYPCQCKLTADITMISTSELDVAITVSVKLKSKQIVVSARNNSGVVIIGDKKFNYSTPSLEHYESETATFEFVSQSRTVTRNKDGTLTLDVGATWPFNGTYSNVEIGVMSALGTLTINSDGSVNAH